MIPRQLHDLPSADRAPVVFIGHGSPMNAVEENRFTEAWIALGKRLQKPKAILSLSAHWFTQGGFVMESEQPSTVHDFYGFPGSLYGTTYPAPGSPETAREVQRTVRSSSLELTTRWGLDHGTWVPLTRIFPEADVPTFQVSIDFSRPAEFHYGLGEELSKLRDKGVLILASGNAVHNLGMADFRQWDMAFPWATEFESVILQRLQEGDYRSLIRHEKFGQAAELSVPTPDHYWPMLSALGAMRKDEKVEVVVDGVVAGSVSMLSFLAR
jgi:4,5-DOPA dioxygenase extradiol